MGAIAFWWREIHSFLNPLVSELESFGWVLKRYCVWCVTYQLPEKPHMCSSLWMLSMFQVLSWKFRMTRIFRLWPSKLASLEIVKIIKLLVWARKRFPHLLNGKKRNLWGIALYCVSLIWTFHKWLWLILCITCFLVQLSTFCIEKGILSSKQFEIIQDRINGVVGPPGIGRIPHKISSAFSGSTACLSMEKLD